jgi:hypothetical protein
MYNKKVYLAKSNFASGLDVEYVKSSLLRIPGIQIVEFVSGLSPSECACIVIVPKKLERTLKVEEKLEKKLIEILHDYIVQNEGEVSDEQILLFNKTDYSDCIEHSKPTALMCEDIDSKKVFLYEKPVCLLSVVSNLIGENPSAWKYNTRHYKPSNGFEMPSIVPKDVRRNKSISRNTSVNDTNTQQQNENVYFNLSEDTEINLSSTDRRRRR